VVSEEYGDIAVIPHDDRDEEGRRYAPRVISEDNAYLMSSMMRDVIRRGTGAKARSLERSDLAGKTGTTNDQRDAWFCGFTPRLVATVWVGFDQFEQLGNGETGAKAALPMWIAYMREALKGVPQELPPMPADMVTLRIDPENGLLLPPEAPGGIEEIFSEENQPTDYSENTRTVPRGKSVTDDSQAPEPLF
jgi:penicillin-binding protein 1A